MAKGDSGRELGQNLRHSVGLARDLGASLGKTGQAIAGAGLSAAHLAESIAAAAGASKALATGLTLGIAAIATAVAGVISWKEGTKEIQQNLAGIRRETAGLNAEAAGDDLLKKQLAIVDAKQKELETAEKTYNILRRQTQEYKDLIAAINAKSNAANAALTAEALRTFQQRSFGLFQEGELSRAGLSHDPNEAARVAARQAARNATDEVNRGVFDTTSDTVGREVGRTQLRNRIQRNLEDELKNIDFQPIKALGDQLGRGVAGAVADGIQVGIQTGNIGKGLKALTGGLLIALGQMMQELGTKALLASSLWASIVSFFGTPAGIGAALAMIAAGSAVEGLGKSLSGGAGGGHSSAATGSVYGSGQTVINRGLIAPGLGTSGSSIQARPVILLQPTIFGTRDADAQRGFLEMFDLAMARRT